MGRDRAYGDVVSHSAPPAEPNGLGGADETADGTTRSRLTSIVLATVKRREPTQHDADQERHRAPRRRTQDRLAAAQL
jgi:hypothetical protein